MIIEENRVVALTYELRINEKTGEVVEKVGKDTPLTFIFGRGNLLPDFEANLDGLKEGDTFSFKLEPEKAYGLVSEEAVVDLPKDIFQVDGKVDPNLLKVGNNIPMQDNSGNRLNGVVMKVEDETVKMDFNHPLAGDTLFFTGEVASVREATEKEIEHGHVHKGSDPCCGGGGDGSCDENSCC